VRTAIASRLPDGALPLATAAVLSVCVGAAVSARPDYVAALVVLVGAAVLGRWNRGVLAGGLALLVLNGLPLVNVEPSATGGNVFDDVTFVALLAVLAACAAANWKEASRDWIVTAACAWAGLYLLWVGSEAARSVGPDESLYSAVKFGRDLVFFGFFVPLGLAGLRRREHLLGFAITLGAGAGLYAVGQILNVALGLGLHWLVHIGKTASFDGLVRIYAPMNDLLIAAFPMAIGTALLGPRKARPWAAGLAVLTGIANALSFTRAVYASETVALLIVGLIYGIRAGWEGARIRRTALVGTACIAVAVALLGGAATGQSGTPLQAVVARTQLGFSDVGDQGGNVGYRLRQARYEAQAVGGQWLTGRGLRTSSSFWVQGERNGSLRNSDLGAFSTLATLGVIGVILIFLPVVAGLVFTLRQRGPVAFGGAMYLGAAIIGSITLATLSSVSGILVVGSVLVLCFNWTADARSATDGPPAEPA
jgi:hypothetical protein